MINFNGVSCEKPRWPRPGRGRYKTVKHPRFSQDASAEILRPHCAHSRDGNETQTARLRRAATTQVKNTALKSCLR